MVAARKPPLPSGPDTVVAVYPASGGCVSHWPAGDGGGPRANLDRHPRSTWVHGDNAR